MRERWNLNVVDLQAREPAPGLWRTSYERCCAHHKVEPLFAALGAYDVWFTGLRRDQSPTRANLKHVDSFRLPDGHQLRKVSPLADWTSAAVGDYARKHAIPLLPLYERGYVSIGCEPCTAVPADPAHPRSGRWGGEKLECGIHLPAAMAEQG
ncbi:MAG: phosphoadenosine phosphosulfate reductase family protein [Vicinamibacterales bacterium]